MKGKIVVLLVPLLISIILLTSCSSSSPFEEWNHTYHLDLYTPLSKSIYSPIVKEFEERYDIGVEIHEESEDNIIELLQGDGSDFSCDIIFGMTLNALEENSDLFESYSAFVSSQLVIIYNTNVVRSRDAPVSFHSLRDPLWKDQIGYVDPSSSVVYEKALIFGAGDSEDIVQYQQQFLNNIDENYASSIDEVNIGVAKGDYSIGVTSEECAKSLLADGAAIAYLYPEEGNCIITNGTAVLKGSVNTGNAMEFLSFTTSNDVKQLLINYLNCSPAKVSAIGGSDS